MYTIKLKLSNFSLAQSVLIYLSSYITDLYRASPDESNQ